MHRKIAQTGSWMPGMIGTSTPESWTGVGAFIHDSSRVPRIGTLSAAENGLVTVMAASSCLVTEGIPWRYQERPIGITKRASRVE